MDFDTIFTQYICHHDKYESLYVFIMYNLKKTDVDGHFNKLLKLLDSLTDSRKKNFLKTRISYFKFYIDELDNEVINSIFLVSEKINEFPLTDYHINTLKMFGIPNFIYEYGKNYNIEWLRDLILNRDYITVIKIRDTTTITQLTPYKEYLEKTYSKKIINIDDIINSINKDKQFIILYDKKIIKDIKAIKNKLCLGIFENDFSPDQLLVKIDELKYQENIKELESWLSKLLDPTEGHKLVFGKDVAEYADNSMLETIYCIFDEKKKYNNTNIKLVKSFVKTDFIAQFIKNYDGVLGIKYY